MARVVKRFKPAYRIKIRRALSRQESLKACLRKLGCLLKYSLQDGMSKILSPTTGHPTAYGKFVMNKYMKTKNA